MQKDFETYQKLFRDFEILPKFPDTHVFRSSIRHPYCVQFMFFFGSMLREFHHILWDMSAVLNDAYLLVLFSKGTMITLNIFYRLSCWLSHISKI